MDIIIRKEEKEDYSAVYELNRRSFNRENEAQLVDRLRTGDSFIPELSLVASFENKVIGHILFTKIKIVDQSKNEFESLALAPMAILPEFQNKSIGGQLILYGFEIAKKLNYSSVIVLGHEKYYPKFGFQPAEKWQIFPPFKVPKNVFMAIELIPNAFTNKKGIVHYPKEFEEV